MNVYIFKSVDGITDNWHDGGGLVIVTDRDPLATFNDYAATVDDYEAKAIDKLPAPDTVFEADVPMERVYVFPDTGCC